MRTHIFTLFPRGAFFPPFSDPCGPSPTAGTAAWGESPLCAAWRFRAPTSHFHSDCTNPKIYTVDSQSDFVPPPSPPTFGSLVRGVIFQLGPPHCPGSKYLSLFFLKCCFVEFSFAFVQFLPPPTPTARFFWPTFLHFSGSDLSPRFVDTKKWFHFSLVLSFVSNFPQHFMGPVFGSSGTAKQPLAYIFPILRSLPVSLSPGSESQRLSVSPPPPSVSL